MAKKFGEERGSAAGIKLDYYKFDMGENRFRLVGDILPRYAYWREAIITDSNDVEIKLNIPIECLRFDRELEQFTNAEKDWYLHYFPDEVKNCHWSYLIQVIDPKDNKIRVLGLKKKLYEAIKDLAKELGDPTDIDTGWEVICEKKKNGPLTYNIEYKLKERKIKPAPLTDEQKELVANMKPIDELVPRQTADEQKAFIERMFFSKAKEKSEDISPEDADDISSLDDDTPF